MKNIEDINKANVKKISAEKKLPEFFPGDIIKVGVKITEGKRDRIQYFEGVCIAKKNRDLTLPFCRSIINRDLQGALEGWMPNGQHDPSAVELAQEALAGSINNALSFTYQLIEIIQDRVKYTKRHTGPAWPASRTLRERIGSCRDLAMLMVEACRSIGIPSRFVSGYHFEDPLPSELDLHAWAELYIPGAGWRGFDPSGKGLIDDRYLTLVSSSKSNLTSVITGNFIGKNNLENTLSWEIKPLEIK